MSSMSAQEYDPTLELNELLFGHEDILVHSILTCLSPLELLDVASTCHYMNNLIFKDEFGENSMWIFKKLCERDVIQELKLQQERSNAISMYEEPELNNENEEKAVGAVGSSLSLEKLALVEQQLNEQLREYGTYRRLFMNLFCTYCFDVSRQKIPSPDIYNRNYFERNNTIFSCYQTWHTAVAKKKLLPGSVEKWKFIVEKYEKGTNSFEMIIGAIVPIDKVEYRPDEGSSHFSPTTFGVGMSVADWAERVGSNSVRLPERITTETERGHEFGFIFDYREKVPSMDIYFNGKLIIQGLKPPMSTNDRDLVFHPAVSLCTKKSVRIAPWLTTKGK